MEAIEQQHLRKALFWQRMMVALGAMSVALVLAFGFAYQILSHELRTEEWVVATVVGCMVLWAGAIFYFLFKNTQWTARYLNSEREEDLLQVVRYQRLFWQNLCILLVSIAVLFVGFFVFLIFLFSGMRM